jgi:type I restriction enzyme R subunit
MTNGAHTKYYGNTVRSEYIKEAGVGVVKKGKRSSNSFEFIDVGCEEAK